LSEGLCQQWQGGVKSFTASVIALTGLSRNSLWRFGMTIAECPMF
jgi:hypothetical protein